MTRSTVARFGLLTLLAGSAFAGGAIAGTDDGDVTPPRHFTNADFRGDYAMLEIGLVEQLPFMEISEIQADGAGNLTVDAIGNFGGVKALRVKLNCTYDFRDNGIGHMICTDPEGEVTTANMVLTDGGERVNLITEPSPFGGYTHATLRRQ
jgi:hypothetical protein